MTKNQIKVQNFINKALNELFKSVGFKRYDSTFVDEFPNDWFTRFAWEKETEEKFKQFFIENARKDLKLSKEKAEKECDWFLLNYSWKNKK